MMQQQSANYGQRGGIVRVLLVLFVVGVLLGAAALGGGYWWFEKKVTEPGPLADNAIIWIKPGMDVSSIASELTERNVVSSDVVFKVAVRLSETQSRLKAGEYEIPAGASIEDVIQILVEGKPYLHTLTIAEGLTTRNILALVEANDILEGEITVNADEGKLLPETYAFPRGETRDAFIRRLKSAQEKVLSELWEKRAADLPIETPEEAVILASIVEKETGVANERPKVASVFVNRLRNGMRLQSDPTIIYGLTGGEPLGRGLRVSEIRGETPYNTYVIRGLPPTPIANPGRESIAAVLNPLETDYIFFVADGTGGHAFAETLREHEKNVRKWREIERQRNSN